MTEEEEKDTWLRGGRKIAALTALVIINVGTPILFSNARISDSITMTVLATVSSLGAIYFGANVASKKYGE